MTYVKSSLFCMLICFSLSSPIIAQDSISSSPAFNKMRLGLLLGSSGSVYATSMIGLNSLWYKDYPKSNFHFFNDNDEWMQMDKFGHSLAAYYESLIGIQGLKWAGVENRKSIIYGSLFGLVFQLPIEILDGFSANWGASSGDLIANTLGAGLVFSQFMLWDEQKIVYKFSFHPTEFASMRSDLLGENLVQNIIKDYNGSTYWLSFSPQSFMKKESWIPDWLCLSLGYGADNMLGVSYAKTPDEYLHYVPYRQFYFSLDVNTLKIPTKNKFVKALLVGLSIIKIPAPTVEINSQGNVRFHPIYF
ncbi:MAG: DUF2279 domain-containing protein [Bacteroidetes bacterium]|jgi:hypothetical protein|nr:DUF2279 domain-containing protein [Bacteroidota bacterium]MBT3802316.1 DUF2279 domain-containing protein [Bacteroidota bacterium]MBT5989409.1 DUF2279 domain-containing protein [Bacteroidota bacterium]MBT6836473.1 DUF2279 domain-containing protein [Bacteroidota bacterium]MBT7993901.1 DUF2279 domain-containing protein [Bacteroidota bacterium]